MNIHLMTYKRLTIVSMIILLISVVQFTSYGQGARKIYWSEDGKIRRANLDGSNVENVLTNDNWIRDIALDIQNHKIYWIGGAHSIKRANLDGTDVETIYNPQALNADKVERIHSPVTITLDTSAEKIYWGNMWGPWGMTRADLDGTNIEDIIILPVNGGVFNIRVDAEDIQLDVKEGKIYFQDSLNDNIARVDMDGSNYENLPLTTPYHDKIALDLSNNRIFRTTIIFNEIRSYFLDGTNRDIILTNLNYPIHIALDVHSQIIYWSERNHETEESTIRTVNFDGTNATDLLTGLNYVYGIALDTEGVYGVSPEKNQITTTWGNIKAE
ncbi:MAG: hypothetical protein OXD54_06170 [Candidatus Poribacteria bacterium]|nr:hypothetical protein [Candidatus Poribacteria bacterium]